MPGENSRETQARVAGEVERVCFLERAEARAARRCLVRMLGQLAALTLFVLLVVEAGLLFAPSIGAHAKHGIVAIVVTSGWAAFFLARAIIKRAVKPWQLAVHDATRARMRLQNLLGS